jgi:hypothetical protein
MSSATAGGGEIRNFDNVFHKFELLIVPASDWLDLCG